jgi:hypothetical protein
MVSSYTKTVALWAFMAQNGLEDVKIVRIRGRVPLE